MNLEGGCNRKQLFWFWVMKLLKCISPSQIGLESAESVCKVSYGPKHYTLEFGGKRIQNGQWLKFEENLRKLEITERIKRVLLSSKCSKSKWKIKNVQLWVHITKYAQMTILLKIQLFQVCLGRQGGVACGNTAF